MIDPVMNDSSLQESRSEQAKSEQAWINAGRLDSPIKLHFMHVMHLDLNA